MSSLDLDALKDKLKFESELDELDGQITSQFKKMADNVLNSEIGDLRISLKKVFDTITKYDSLLNEFLEKHPSKTGSHNPKIWEGNFNKISNLLTINSAKFVRKGFHTEAKLIDEFLTSRLNPQSLKEESSSKFRSKTDKEWEQLLGTADRKKEYGDLYGSMNIIENIQINAFKANNYYIVCKALISKIDLYGSLQDNWKALETIDKFEEFSRKYIFKGEEFTSWPTPNKNPVSGSTLSMLKASLDHIPAEQQDFFTKKQDIEAELLSNNIARARHLIKVEKYDEARLLYLKLIDHSQNYGLPGEPQKGEFIPLLYSQLDLIDILSGKIEKGLKGLIEVEPILLMNKGFASRMADFYELKASAQLKLGQIEDALKTILHAEELAQNINDQGALWLVLAQKGNILSTLNRLEEALSSYTISVNIINDLMKQPLGFSIDNIYLKRKFEIFDKAINVAIKLNRFQDACKFIELVKSRTLTQFLRTKKSTSDTLHSDLVNQFQELENELVGLNLARNKGQDVKEEISEIKRKKEQILSRIKGSNPRWHQLSEGIDINFDQLYQELKLRNAAIINLYYWQDALHIFIISESGIEYKKANTLIKWLKHETDIRGGRSHRDLIAPIHSFHKNDRLDLNQIIPESILEKVTSLHSLMIIPHGKLHNISWSELEYKDRKLFEFIPISLLPNLNTFLIQSQSFVDYRSRESSVVLFGAPNNSTSKNSQFLPYVKKEIDGLSLIYKSSFDTNTKISSFYGSQATTACFKELIQKPHDTFHIACHGTQNIELPMESSLVLSDGEISAGFLSNSTLEIKELILSSCYAGWRPEKIEDEKIYGDEVLGIPGALMEAGIPTLLFSIKPVGDEAAQNFMTYYHKFRSEGMQPIIAFQKTQLEMHKNFPMELWNGFTLYGILHSIGENNQGNQSTTVLEFSGPERKKSIYGKTKNVIQGIPKAKNREEKLSELRNKAIQNRKESKPQIESDFVRDSERMKNIHDEITQRIQNETKGFWGSLWQGVKCTIKHKGEWFYTEVDSCNMVRMCERCGKIKEKVEHNWDHEQRILEDKCEFISSCKRCDEELISFSHVWEWKYESKKNCNQIKQCAHCHEKGTETRITHEWGSWHGSSADQSLKRECRRCGDKETKENPDYVSEYVQTQNVYSSQSPNSIFGRWYDNYNYWYHIQQIGSIIYVKGYQANNIEVLQGQGRISGHLVEFEYHFNDGYNYNKGIYKLSLSNYGRNLTGIIYSPKGNVEVLLVKG